MASEDVILRFPILTYGLECYFKAVGRSLDFVVTLFLMKLFKSAHMVTNSDC